MSITEVEQQQLLIGGEWRDAAGGGTLRAHRPLHRRSRRTVAAAARDDARRGGGRRGRGLPGVGGLAAGPRRELLQKAAGLLSERAHDIAPIVTAETGGTFGWGMFNCSLAAAMLGRPPPRRPP